MDATEYAITVSLFSVAYAVFEVPSNWIMKHYIRPSLWLAILLGCWGAVTIGFGELGPMLDLSLHVDFFSSALPGENLAVYPSWNPYADSRTKAGVLNYGTVLVLRLLIGLVRKPDFNSTGMCVPRPIFWVCIV
jgi:hypothetical protein